MKMKKAFENFKEKWGKVPNSVKFWNLLALATFIACGFAGLSWFAAFQGVTALGLIGLITITYAVEDEELKHHYWIFLMPSTWLLMCIYFVAVFVYDMKDEYIPRFNEWIDRICGK